jgi:hypothetical protein
MCVCEWVPVKSKDPVWTSRDLKLQACWIHSFEFFIVWGYNECTPYIQHFLFQFCTIFHDMTKVITTQNMHIFT